MSTQKKPLKPHAVTCIKNKLVEHIQSNPNAGLAYTVHCDREDCWNQTELIGNYICAVNILENGFTTGDQIKKRLSSGESVCAYRSILEVELEIYAKGCEDALNVAMSVLADVVGGLHSCKGKAFPYAKNIKEDILRRDLETRYSDKKVLITQSLSIRFDYVPCQPCLIFKYK